MASTLSSLVGRVAAESGFSAAIRSGRDTKILAMQRFVRMFAYGTSFLILVDFLTSLGIADSRVGVFMTLTLLGDVLISLLLTSITDSIGRRRVLGAGACLMILSGFVFYISTNYWLLLLASVVGVISPSGNEIGPFRAIEESTLAQLTPKEVRSDIFAYYTLFGTAGAALGTLTCGWMVQKLQEREGWTKVDAYHIVFLVYAALGLVKLGLIVILSRAVEAEAPKDPVYEAVSTELQENLLSEDEGSDDDLEGEHAEQRRRATSSRPPPPRSLMDRVLSLFPRISPMSRSILYRLIVLFAMDSYASGIASPSWLTYFFTTVHSLEPSSLGTLFLVTNLLATVSNLLALPLARRIGPLKTMVFTHLPSAIFLAMIPLPGAGAPGTFFAMAFLALRACTSSMDQAPRQAFLAAAVLPAERTAVMGVVNTAKTLAQAGGLGTSGFLSGNGLWVLAFGGAGLLKAGYDLLMLWMFVNLKDREETERAAAARDEEERS